jgi:hypothetical protein
VRTDRGVRISFAVTRATDVAVRIRKAGRTVRHLAAGVLGDSPPPPLKPGLRQVLDWDGTDDAGRPVEPAGCTVQVCLGLTPTLDRMLGWRGEAVGTEGSAHRAGVVGFAVEPDGRCFVLYSGSKKPTCMFVFSRAGKYLRTVMPYPANLPYEKVKHLGVLRLPDGRHGPIIRHPVMFALYPDAYGLSQGIDGLPCQSMARVGDQVVMVNAWTSRYGPKRGGMGPRRLLILNQDGSIPDNYLGPVLTGDHTPGFVQLVAAQDGKSVFAAGLRGTHAVYKVALDQKGPARCFLGEAGKPGKGKTHLNDPRGLAADRHGNLYVADYGNARIAVFTQGGQFLGEIPAEAPAFLAVHQRTGAIYHLTIRRDHPVNLWCSKLTKLSAVVDATGRWTGGGQVLGSMPWRNYFWQSFAVDGYGESTQIWVGGKATCEGLYRVQEKGGEFGPAVPTCPATEPVITSGGFLAVDRRTEDLYTQALGGTQRLGWVRINGRTGAAERLKIPGEDIAVGPEGHLYVLKKNQILRFDRNGEPAPFAGTGTNVLEARTARPYARGPAHGARGHCVGADGSIYLMGYEKSPTGRTVVDVCGPDGRLQRRRVIWMPVDAAGIQVDPAGNLYLTSSIKPKNSIVPAELAGQVPLGRRWNGRFNWYPWMHGSVVKFPPAGGGIAGAPDWTPPEGTEPRPVEYVAGYGTEKVAVRNACWVRPGISPAPGAKGVQSCVCLVARSAVDAFGRVFMPDATTFSVRVVDTNGNPIVRFGSYGNMDSAGADSAVPEPAIPFAWPQYAAVSDEAVYVSDVINRRIVRVKLDYRVQGRCPIP